MEEKYKKPKCACGAVLHASLNEIWKVKRYITNDGQLGNIVGYNKFLDDQGYEVTLRCPKCYKEYEADYDDKNRLIRGEQK